MLLLSIPILRISSCSAIKTWSPFHVEDKGILARKWEWSISIEESLLPLSLGDGVLRPLSVSTKS